MWPAPIVILLPFFKRMAGIGQRAEERFIEAFVSELAVKAFNEAVLLGFSRCDIVPINVSLLNLFKDRHAGELGSPSRAFAMQTPAGQWLSETIVFGMPRSAITLSSSRTTR